MTTTELLTCETRLREFFDLPAHLPLRAPGATPPRLSAPAEQHLRRLGFEWHLIPSADIVPWDEGYTARLYPTGGPALRQPLHHGPTLLEMLALGHRRHQGRFVAIETTQKPGYLPGNVQCYGTPYGFDSLTDPLTAFMGQAGFVTRTRYDHNFTSLTELIRLLDRTWRGQDLIPTGYRVSICAPVVFNLIGTLFHPEWSRTASLELGFYRDGHGNAQCFSVGPNGPEDFSFVRLIETEGEWTHLGFRLALVPED
ncbi:MAG: hypothetical protein AB7L71_00220 [Vicinamibacterales bacterium]